MAMSKKERSEAAKKAAATRKKNAEELAKKRSDAAKKAWATRRANEKKSKWKKK